MRWGSAGQRWRTLRKCRCWVTGSDDESGTAAPKLIEEEGQRRRRRAVASVVAAVVVAVVVASPAAGDRSLTATYATYVGTPARGRCGGQGVRSACCRRNAAYPSTFGTRTSEGTRASASAAGWHASLYGHQYQWRHRRIPHSNPLFRRLLFPPPPPPPPLLPPPPPLPPHRPDAWSRSTCQITTSTTRASASWFPASLLRTALSRS